MTSQYETNLWSTHVNIVRLAEPIRRWVRWRTQVFKIEGFVCKRFLPPLPPPPLSLFGSRFISRVVKTESPLPRYFFAPKPNENACYSGYWPRGFGELKPSPHSWVFTSVSVDSSPRSYLFTSATGRIRVHIAQNLSDIWRSTFEIGVGQLCFETENAPKSPFLWWTEALFSIVSVPAQKLSGIVWT